MHALPVRRLFFIGCFLAFINAFPLLAQDADTMRVQLPPIEIEAARSQAVTQKSAAISVSVRARDPESRNLEAGLSLQDILGDLPGLWINDRYNAAVGERISIRGMGWRTAFGVRGVQILLDGIPLTMPDGQAFADIVTPSLIQRAELIRGPASLYWGNGSGGVLYLTSLQPDAETGVRLRAMGGSYGLRQLTAEGQAQIGVNRFHVTVDDDRRDGYRAHSNSRFTRASFHGILPLSDRTIVRLMSAFADQDAENPGSLNAAQATDDPRLANAGNVAALAAKRSQQFQVGGTLLHESPIGELSGTAYGIFRDLDNPLSFAYIDLNRSAGGIRVALEDSYDRFGWGLGADAGLQDDDRLNWENIDGQRGPDQTLAQRETVQALSAYGFLNAMLVGDLQATLGIRADRIRFEMQDRLLSNGDESGDRLFSAISPAFGLAYLWPQATLYANYRSAFETPTTTELVNRPDLTGGFNPDIDPQRTKGFELGFRGAAEPWSVNYDIALYTMNVEDRLVPFTTEAGGDRTFYRNTGRNLHRGVELALDLTPARGLNVRAMHTSNDFEYKDDELDGLKLPGIPDHRTAITARHASKMMWVQLGFEHVSSYFVDDANTEKNDAYQVVDVNVGHPGLVVGPTTFQPFIRIGNLFDQQYSGSVIINAFGGRYYEPAPGRTLQVGLNVAL